MILLSLILSLFAQTVVTDNCTSQLCNAVIKVDGVQKFGQNQAPKDKLLSWISGRKDRKTSWGNPGDYTVELVDAYSNTERRMNGFKKVNSTCTRVTEMILRFIISGDFTADQMDELDIEFYGILQALQKRRADTAKVLVQGLNPASSLVTAKLKSDVLAKLNASGFPGI